MELIEKYCNTEFSSYEDFYENFRFKRPENFNFGYDVVDVLAETKPNERALLWCNDHGDERTFTFADMKRLSDKTASFLASLGVKKGDFVMLILKRHWEFWPCMMALHKIGAVAIPATHLLTAKDIVYRCQLAEISTIVATGDGEVCKHVDDAAPQCPSLVNRVYVKTAESGPMRDGWVDFLSGMEEASENWVRPTGDAATCNEDYLLLYFTSGTSGEPKMVVHNQLYPIGHIITAKFWHNLSPGTLHFTVADTGWGKTAWGKLYGQWFCEACVFVYDYSSRFQPTDLLERIEQYKVESFCAPPTIFRFFIKEDLTKYDLSSLKYASIAGEPLNPEIYYQFERATGLQLHESFGQTESVCAIGNFVWMTPKPGSMGRPSPTFQIDIVDEDGNSCEPGVEGEVVMRLDKRNDLIGVFAGYYKDEERNETTWHDGMYHMGDIAWKDEDGYYWYVGRADDVIKSSGYRIGPFEVESALLTHPAVLETAITAVPDELRGQVVKATVVLARGYKPSEELKKELQNHVKQTTAPYKYPRIVEFADELPKTISGKIRRVQLREHDIHIMSLKNKK